MFAKARSWLASKIAPPKARSSGKRMYAGAVVSRLNADWVTLSTSADSEIRTSLRMLRNRTRELVRDNDYAKNAVRLIKNNVIGTGIGFQAQVMMRRGGKLDEISNDAIEDAWKRWGRKETCHVGGTLSLVDIERMIAGALPESGEILVRKIKRSFGGGRVPFALEIIESDQLVDDFQLSRADNGNRVKMGVELDQWNRPVAYWLYPSHPGDYLFQVAPNSSKFTRVPAEEIEHLFIPERPGQTRGVPWFHAAIKRLNNMGAYEEAEIVAARASACVMGMIESPQPDSGDDGVQDGESVTNLAAGEIMKMQPGEKFVGFSPNRPNSGMDPFMRLMLRGVASSVGISYASLSRDYSQSNYSSSRLDLLDERDSWRAIQGWMIENFLQRIYEEWLEMAVLSGELNLPGYSAQPEVYRSVRWMARGWDWIDPLKEAMAAKLAVRSGITDLATVIGAKGGDVEDVFRQRRREIDLAAQYKLILETDPAQVTDKGQVQPLPAVQETDTGTPQATDGTDSMEKMIARLFEEMQHALDRNQDEHAGAILQRIETVEKLAARGIVLQIDNHLPEISPHFEAVLPEAGPVTKSISIKRADGSTLTAEVTETK